MTHCGRICFKGRKINLSHVFAEQQVGIKQVDDRIWLVSFMHYDLGYFDDETCRLEPIENPFGPTVLLMSSEYTVTHVPGIDQGKMAHQSGQLSQLVDLDLRSAKRDENQRVRIAPRAARSK